MFPWTALGSWLLFQHPWIPRGRFRASFIPCSRSSSGGMPSELAGSEGIPVPRGLFGIWDAVLGARTDSPWWGFWSLQVWDTGLFLSSCSTLGSILALCICRPVGRLSGLLLVPPVCLCSLNVVLSLLPISYLSFSWWVTLYVFLTLSKAMEDFFALCLILDEHKILKV